jgi:hypothetical protein
MFHGVEENIWNEETGSNRRIEKNTHLTTLKSLA